VHPVLEAEFQRPGSRPEEDGPDLALVVFEGEVKMARCGPSKVGDLAFDPELIEGGFQDILDLPGELCDGQNLAGRKEIHGKEVAEGAKRCKGFVPHRCLRKGLSLFDFFKALG
jgi:hypothetical protein